MNHLHRNQPLSDLVKILSLNEKKTYPTSIPHKIGEKIILVKLADITYFKADSKYVNFYNVESKEFLTEQSLQNLEDKLPPEFIRISKSVIINSTHVIELHKYLRGKYILTINDLRRTKVETGASYYNQIKGKFNI